MSELSAFLGPIMGMAGVVIGSLLNEHIRRRRRVEEYATTIFSKRLEAYEGLILLIKEGSSIASDIIDNKMLSLNERHATISKVILEIIEHVENNTLYIDEEIGSHCTALFMGTEDIQDLPENDRNQALEDYHKMRNEAIRMIYEDSGVAQVNSFFRAIYKPTISSEFIDRVRYLKNERKKQT